MGSLVCMQLMGIPLAKSRVTQPALCTPQLISVGWSCSCRSHHSPFTYTQSGLKCREESFHYHVELEAALRLYLGKSKTVYSYGTVFFFVFCFLREENLAKTGIDSRFFSCVSQNRKNVSEPRAPEIASECPVVTPH